MASRHRRRRLDLRALLHHGDRLPLHAQPAAHPGPRDLRRAGPSHGTLAPREGKLHGKAGRRHRDGLVGDPVDPADRRAGRAPLRLPAHAQLLGPRPQRPAGSRVRQIGEGGLRRHARPREEDPSRDRRPLQSQPGARGGAGGARGRVRAALAARRPHVHGRLRRSHHGEGSQRHGGRVRAREDPRDGRRSGGRGAAVPEEHHRLQAAVRGHRLLRDLQP